jgi:hypothetical protein
MEKTMALEDELKEAFQYDPATGIVTWKLPAKGRTLERPLGTPIKGGYLILTFKRRQHLLHRVAWLLANGAWPEGDIDHINGDPSDNRICNLRDVPHVENMRNQKLPSDNKSGRIGVLYRKRDKVWCARISVNGKRVHLGSFKTKEDAEAARNLAETQAGYHPNHGRIVPYRAKG